MKKDKITVDKLLKKIPNKYELAIAAGKAARIENANGMEKSKIMDYVFEEIMDNKIIID